ncbi:quinoprotein dehydrogenase-associated SoxYZ-like carrier [Erythrobacter tepidarius]|uniref:quinoprotein dehydrogenase-associated SoxYZ-like carrier n=1 Tax=Erythrobacter tepidarius TaxID=60454 RepID=UPI000A390908|nr:quinoprotein dehydrogenase-associated SoxYZ-like carrier [Erythrobacter tepidarius]
MIRSLLSLALGASALATPAAALAEPLPADPLGSPMWEYHAGKLFAGAPVVFDPRVMVALPMLTENQHVMPVTVDARALNEVKRIVIFADLNPIPVAVEYTPLAAHAFIATRIKLDQRTPVRAAVLTADGVWHVAGGWVDAAGGGCSAPPVSRVRGDWADHLGELRGAVWQGADAIRVRMSLRHPMDTGLVENIPAYNLEQLTVSDAHGTPLARLVVHGSVSEDPVFTLMLAPAAKGELAVSGRDTGGLEFGGRLLPTSGTRIAAAVAR